MFKVNPAPAKAGAAKGAETPTTSPALRISMIVLILAPTLAAVIAYYWLLVHPLDATAAERLPGWFKFLAMMTLSVILPLLAYSYYFYRRERRITEVKRIVRALSLDKQPYVRMFKKVHSGPYFVIAVGITYVITLGGLAILFFNGAIWTAPPEAAGDQPLINQNSLMIFGMAFLGAYMWGLQYVLRRYVLNDLIPGAFFKLSIRMLMASIVALLLFNAYDILSGAEAGASPGHAWPAMAFLLGAFPQRGLNWLMARIPMMSAHPDPSVRVLPLAMIEGMNDYDRMRLEEIGIEDCYDLANYDFMPLVLKTSYSARKVADWILQAKLCVRFGHAVGSLREQGIRGIHELAALGPEDLPALAKTTGATEACLGHAYRIARSDPDIARLQAVAGLLSKYTDLPVPEAPAPEPPAPEPPTPDPPAAEEAAPSPAAGPEPARPALEPEGNGARRDPAEPRH